MRTAPPSNRARPDSVAPRTSLTTFWLAALTSSATVLAGDEGSPGAVETRTDGRIMVRLYPNNQLGNQRDVVEGLQIGSIEVSNIASVMSAFVPETKWTSSRIWRACNKP